MPEGHTLPPLGVILASLSEGNRRRRVRIESMGMGDLPYSGSKAVSKAKETKGHRFFFTPSLPLCLPLKAKLRESSIPPTLPLCTYSFGVQVRRRRRRVQVRTPVYLLTPSGYARKAKLRSRTRTSYALWASPKGTAGEEVKYALRARVNKGVRGTHFLCLPFQGDRLYFLATLENPLFTPYGGTYRKYEGNRR